MDAQQVYAVLNRKIKLGGGSTADIQNAVNNYLNANPVEPGATQEQAQQIEDNKNAIESLKEDVDNLSQSIGSSGSGTTDYEKLQNKPKINDVTLEQNKTFEDLGISPLSNVEIMRIINNASN